MTRGGLWTRVNLEAEPHFQNFPLLSGSGRPVRRILEGMWMEVVRRCGRPPTWVRLVAGEASALPAGRCGSRGSPSPAACPGVPGSAQRAEPPRHWRARSRRGHPRRHEPVSGGKARRPLPTRPLSACRPEEEARRRPRPGREEAWPARARPRQCARRAFRIRPSVRVSDRPSSLSARPRQVQGGAAPASVRAPLPRPGCEPGRGSGSGIPDRKSVV